MKGRTARRRSRRGFTLLELGIVIAVAAILAAAIVPDFIEITKNQYAATAAAQVASIQDAARIFYLQNTNLNLGSARWPGQSTASTCTPDGTGAAFDLAAGGWVPGGVTNVKQAFLNPWGGQIDGNLLATPTTQACLFSLGTQVPAAIAPLFTSYLPMSGCSNAPPNPCPPDPNAATLPADFVYCCSFIPKPSAQMGSPCPIGQQPFFNGAALSCH